MAQNFISIIPTILYQYK